MAPSGDIGEESGETGIVQVTDDGAGTSCFLDCGWSAGGGATGNTDTCDVTIGASTSTQMILGVGDEGTLCTALLEDYVSSGDNITVTLFNPDGSTFASATQTALPLGTVPTVSGVTPPYGPTGGGTAAAPGTGTVTVETSGTSAAPEAIWFASTGITTDLFGVATTDFSATGNPGEYTVVPPAFSYGGDAQNDGVSVLVADPTNGMSQVDCTLEVAGCADEYLYLDSDSGSFTSPSLTGFELTQQLSSFSDSGNACGQTVYNNASPGGSVTVNFSGGPIGVSANYGTSDSDSGLPEALLGNVTVTVENPITVEISGNLEVGGCLEVPFPDLALPDGLGGLYFVVGGSINGSINLTVTIDQGSYTINGGFIPGSQPADIGGAKVTTNCVDSNGNPTTDCVTTQLSAALTGTVVLAPLWLSFGPQEINVGAGLLAAATGTITYPPSASANGQTVDYDVCAGGLATAQLQVGDFSASYSYPWAGPINIVGDGSICPIGSITSTSPSSPVSDTTAPTLSPGPYADGSAITVADPGTWTTPDTSTYTYAWEDCTDATGATCTPIANATDPSYTPTSSDVGQFVGVTVTDTDGENDTGTATVVSTTAVGDPPPPSDSGLPSITGAPTFPTTLSTAPATGWTSPDTLTYTEQWETCTSADVATCSPIPGATGDTYKLASTDVGDYVTVAVTATDAENQATTATATPIGPVTGGAPKNTVLPKITGTASPGSTIRTSKGVWKTSVHPLKFTYQWEYTTVGGTPQPIDGATKSYFLASKKYLGDQLAVVVTATGSPGESATATSKAVTVTKK